MLTKRRAYNEKVGAMQSLDSVSTHAHPQHILVTRDVCATF